MAATSGDSTFGPEERAAVALASIEGIGPVTLDALRKAFGSLAEAAAAPHEAVAEHLRDEATRARHHAAGDLGSLAERLLERAERIGARVLVPGRTGWPRQLEGAGFPPVMYLKGTIEPERTRVAVVGARRTDRYGEELAAFFGASLAQAQVCVVSGGARGVDAAAHRAALGNNGATIAVLGSGVDICYPGEHRGLFAEIVARGGALVSHFPPGVPAVPQNFKVRNRLIAALSDAVVVARAGSESGALSTARAAQDLGRPVFAVPGDVTCPLSCGGNALLESGAARAAVGLAPVAQAIGLPAGDWPSASAESKAPVRPSARSPVPQPAPTRPASDVPEALRPVWNALGNEPSQFDDLLGRCGLDAPRLANALLRLEVIGLCQERAGKVFVRM